MEVGHFRNSTITPIWEGQVGVYRQPTPVSTARTMIQSRAQTHGVVRGGPALCHRATVLFRLSVDLTSLCVMFSEIKLEQVGYEDYIVHVVCMPLPTTSTILLSFAMLVT